MRDNRLFLPSELEDPEYCEFVKEFEGSVPEFWIGENNNRWEHWAGLEGLDWSRYQSVLDVGSFYSGVPFYLKKKAGQVLAIDNYDALEQEGHGFCYSSGLWEEVMKQFRIRAWRQDARFEFVLEPKPDLITCFATLQFIDEWPQAIKHLLELSPNLIVTTCASEMGVAWDEKEGRQFSFRGLEDLAGMMDAEIDLSHAHEVPNQTVAMIRKVT